MKPLLTLNTKLFLLSFVSSCTIVLATTVPPLKNFIAPENANAEQKKENTFRRKPVKQRATPEATLISDLPDYAPLSTATFTGSGFAPNEDVVLKVKNLSQPCNTVSADSSYFPWTVTADDDGHFITTWTVCDCAGDSLRLKAIGEISGSTVYLYFSDASPGSLGNYNVNGLTGTPVSITPSNVAANIMFSGLTRSSGISGASGTNVFSSDQWTVNAASIVADEYLEFTISPANCHGFSLSELRIGLSRSLQGPAKAEIRFSEDSYGSFLGSVITVNTLVDVSIINLSAITSLQNRTTPVTFRLYAYGATGGGGTLRLDRKTSPAMIGLEVDGVVSAFDATPPVLTAAGTTLTLGCNPLASDINAALGTASATDVCGTPTLTVITGGMTGTCDKSQTRIFEARDDAGNIATTTRTVTWTEDVTPPDFVGDYSTVVIGCNPAASDITTALGGAAATDACGATTINSVNDADVFTDGCHRSQTRKFIAGDACGNTSSVSRTVIWIADIMPPIIQAGGTTLSLGCSPAASDINDALGTATATDECASATITQSDATVTGTGCSRSQKRIFTARDGCGNTSAIDRIVTWTLDITPPTASCISGNYKCISDVPAPNVLLITDEADNCGGTPTVTYIPTATVDNNAAGCPGDPRIIKRYYLITDDCNNTCTASHTITIADDVAPGVDPKNISVVLGTSGSVSITATDVTASLTDNCSSVSVSVDKTTFTDAELGNTCSKNFTVKLTASDACGNTSTCNATVTVNKRPTKLVYSGDITGQYSDVASLKATLYDITNGYPGTPIPGKTVTFTIGSQSIVDTYGGSGGGTNETGEASGSLTLTQNPVPLYNVVAGFAGDGLYCPSSCSRPFDITPEKACGAYNGTLFVNTVSTSNLSAAVRLQVIVTEVTDGSLGDVRNASIVFTVTDGATSRTHSGILDNANSTVTQAVYYRDTILTLQSNTLCKTLDVSWAIGNDYTNAPNCDNETEVTIAVPANDFSAGGGYIILTSNSQGSNGGTTGTKNNFGYNVKWNNTMTNLQGSFNTLIRRNGRVYQVKSNKPAFLKVTLVAAATGAAPTKRKAEITYANTTLKDVTDIVNGVCVNPLGCWGDGNATVYLVVEDNGEPGPTGGTLDRIGFGVKDKNNNLWFSTNTWTNSTTSAAMQNLDGGNIQIRQTSSTTTAVNNSTTGTNINVDKPADVVSFNVRALPNPGGDEFTIYLEGADNEKATLVLYDASGRQIMRFEKESSNIPIHIGKDLKGGIYMLEVRQGVNRKTIKLIKQNWFP